MILEFCLPQIAKWKQWQIMKGNMCYKLDVSEENSRTIRCQRILNFSLPSKTTDATRIRHKRQLKLQSLIYENTDKSIIINLVSQRTINLKCLHILARKKLVSPAESTRVGNEAWALLQLMVLEGKSTKEQKVVPFLSHVPKSQMHALCRAICSIRYLFYGGI